MSDNNPYPTYWECVRDWEQGKPIEYFSTGEWGPRERKDEAPGHYAWGCGHYRPAQQPAVVPYTAETFPRDRVPWVRRTSWAESERVLILHYTERGVEYPMLNRFHEALWIAFAANFVWADAEHDNEPCGLVKK